MTESEPPKEHPTVADPPILEAALEPTIGGVSGEPMTGEKLNGDKSAEEEAEKTGNNAAGSAEDDNFDGLLDGDFDITKTQQVTRPRGRASKKSRRNSKDEDDEEASAYSESEESAYDESDDDSVESVESEEYDSDEDEDVYSDEEEYARPRGRQSQQRHTQQYNYIQAAAGGGSGGFYNQWAAQQQQPGMMRPPMMMPFQPGMPMLAPRPLPPLVNAAMPGVVRAVNAQGGVRPTLTPAQLQEIAKNTVASLLSGSGSMPAARPPAPPVRAESSAEASANPDSVPRTEPPADKAEASQSSATPASAPTSNDETIKETVGDEIKQNLARILADPQAKQILMQRLWMNQMQKMQQSGQPMPMMQPGMMPLRPGMPMMPMGQPGFMPMMYRPQQQQQHPMMKQKKKEKRVRKPMKYDGDDVDAPIASRRATRSAAKKVDFSRLYQEEEEVDAEIDQYAEEQEEGGPADSSTAVKIRIPKRQVDDLTEIQPEIKSKRGRKPSKRQQQSDSDHDMAIDGEEEEPIGGEDGEEGIVSRGSSVGSDDEPSVSKILSHRINADGEEEFLVKFHGLSYLHTEWISKEEMEGAKMGATRIKKFLGKPLSVHHYDDRNVFNPDYLQIDRILYGWDHPTLEDPKVWTSSYLVKWKSLPYEEVTWEKKEVLQERIPNLADKIAEWMGRPTLESRRDPNQLKIGHRPDRSSWQAMPESPVYKNDNTLRSYQLEGVNWLVYCWINKQSCIIADEMGLGKTVQSVSFIQLIKQQFKVPGPFLVVAPLSTIPHWEREFSSWTDLNVLVFHGTQKSRDIMEEYEFYFKDDNDQIIPNVYKFDVLITTYEMAIAGFDALQPIIWRAGIFDEAHRLKNRGSKAAEVLSLFRLEHKVMLTGTPLQNNLEELFALLHFLQPQRFHSEEDFLEEYGNLQKSEDVSKLQELLRPLMLRRLKEDVEKSIPVKEETVIEVELTSLQKRYYRAILEKNFAFLTKGGKGTNAPNLVNTMMELRKCCIHPYLIKGSEERIVQECNAQTHDDVMNCMIQASGKLVLVDKLLGRLRQEGRKVLIFSQMTRCLDLLTDYLAYRGYPFERIDGAVKGEDRQAAIDRYCNPNNDSFVFLLCTRAGGVGINLTVADTVVIYDSDWNPQNDLQAQARCHRIGQQKSVKVYRLITRNTYEREMFDKAGLKLGLDRAILQRMNNLDDTAPGGLVGAHAPQLSKKEVESLLKRGAYGILMDNDDDSKRFCEEDIDQILSRRTQVIRHGTEASDAAANGGQKETSLFSKATFAATADDYDIDLDDPNFWELWAKRLKLNPKDMLAGSGQSIDEPRVRRQAKRLREESLLDITIPQVTEHDSDMDAPYLWTVKERNQLLELLLLFGPNRMDKILPAFEGRRSRNDLVACIRALIKFCLEHYDSVEGVTPDRNFKEDCEKLLLSNLDFDLGESSIVPPIVDESTGKIDLLAAEYAGGQTQNASSIERPSTPATVKGPYPNAGKEATAAFASFFKGAPSEWLEGLKSIAFKAVLRMQLVDFLRDVVESNSNEAGPPVPPLPGATPAEGWNRKDDQALLMSCYNNGYGAWFNDIPEEGKRNADIEEVSSRFVKLTMAIVKRSQAAAKLAMHQAANPSLVKSRRRRNVRGDDSSGGSSDDDDDDEVVRDEDDDEEEEFLAGDDDDDERPRRGGGSLKKAPAQGYTGKPVQTKVYWGRRDQQEYVKVIRGYGLPLKTDDTDRDWTVFSQLGDFSPSILRSAPASFDEFTGIFLTACEAAASTRKRRRTKKEMEQKKKGSSSSISKGRTSRPYDDEVDVDVGEELLPGELMAADEVGAASFDEEEEEDYDDDGKAAKSKEIKPRMTMAPTLSTARARLMLEVISLLDQIRSPAFISRSDLVDSLSRARRLSILPRWWRAGLHDAAILQAVAKYGFEREDLIIADQSLPFYSIFKDLEKIKKVDSSTPDAAAADKSTKKRKSTVASPKLRPSTLPSLPEGERLVMAEHDWPTLPNLFGRVKKMYDMANDPVSLQHQHQPSKKRSAAPSAAGDADEVEESGAGEVSPKKRQRKSGKAAKEESAVVDDPVTTEVTNPDTI